MHAAAPIIDLPWRAFEDERWCWEFEKGGCGKAYVHVSECVVYAVYRA